MPRKAKSSPDDTAAAEAEIQAEDDAGDSDGQGGQSGAPPILPLVRNSEGWHIDASELTPDCPLWGPYSTKVEANEDRRPTFRKRVRDLRRALTNPPKPV